jgi:hypothetical protein
MTAQLRRSWPTAFGVLTVGVFACDPNLPPVSGWTTGVDGGIEESDAGSATDSGSDAGLAEPHDAGGSVDRDAGSVDRDAGNGVPDAGRPAPDAGQAAGVGGACGSDSDCAGGTCDTQVPGGYCSQTCGSGCPSGSVCSYALGGYCIQSCGSNADCRDAYSCQTQPGQGSACLLDQCYGNFGCPSGKACNNSLGACTDVCRSNADCPSYETCDTGQGYCTTPGGNGGTGGGPPGGP